MVHLSFFHLNKNNAAFFFFFAIIVAVVVHIYGLRRWNCGRYGLHSQLLWILSVIGCFNFNTWAKNDDTKRALTKYGGGSGGVVIEYLQ